jgi:nucleotide-binding universal stress UspA family protein
MKLLLGIGADDDLSALDATVVRAREAGDELTVVTYADEGSTSAVATDRRVQSRLEELGFAAEVRQIQSDPGSRLVELAASGGYDRIVLPGGQRTPMGKISLGETVEFVLLNARTSVTLIR